MAAQFVCLCCWAWCSGLLLWVSYIFFSPTESPFGNDVVFFNQLGIINVVFWG